MADSPSADWTPLSLDYSGVMDSAIGAEHGLTPTELNALAEASSRIVTEVVGETPGFLGILDDVEAIVGPVLETAAWAEGRFDTVVVLGIGGSALGNIALHRALNHPWHNLVSSAERGGRPRVFVVDNVDPAFVAGVLDIVDVKRTLFNVITKSGTTAETMSQFLIVRQMLIDALGDAHKDHVVATTDPQDGLLRQIADAEGYRTLSIPPTVGGRFSVLTPVGLLSAALAGIDIRALMRGACAMAERCRQADMAANPALVGAVTQYLLDTQKGKHISVMMPYSNALFGVADWFRQLWAESLGKIRHQDGSTTHVGPTPVGALGATDQHSQIQLYREGPNDKVVTFIALRDYGRDVTIPEGFAEHSGIAYLGGRTLTELIQAERQATALALTDSGRPNMTVTVDSVRPETLGELFVMLEMQTAIAGKLYGINAYDQPGVEAGKVATYALMGRDGYESQRDEIQKRLEQTTPYVV